MNSSTQSDDIPLPSDEELTLSPPIFTPRPLPQLTNSPQTIPDSCLSLSVPLLRALHALLPPAPSLTLSIGSGTGLVEALLQSLPEAPPLRLVSVEVPPSPNKYHHPHRTVPGTWAVEGLARVAAAWVFVYPKQVALVREYMKLFVEGPGPQVVVYIGPRMDWGDFGGALEGDGREVEVWGEARMEEVGGRGWEVVAVARRTGR
ncbi:hypothetical protein CcaCcLH18_08273 [Colletotrichum camelliae]|nr:hypothetical protein CcaCcLH18_08273 [Colletotrichum camelliae]